MTRSCVDRTFSALTEPQRVGQLFLLGLGDDRLGPQELAAIRRNHFGSVWFTRTTTAGVSAVRSVAEQAQALATADTTGRVRFFVAANQEGGLIQALRGPGFSTIPAAVDQGRLDPGVLRSDARAWGGELVRAGVNLNFAPVMDVVPAGTEQQNQPIGGLHREYGNDPATVGAHGVAFLQGMASAGVTTVAKHFPGLGRVTGNTDVTSGVVDSVTTPDDPDLDSFRQAIVAGVPMVMVALATYTKIDPNRLAVFSPVVMRLLRDTYGFDGVIVSDDLGATAAVADIPPAARAVDFLEAGGDLIISKTVGPAERMADAMLAKATSDPAFRSRVIDAVLRVLRAKNAADLLPCSG
jgi:beta-N-acetylhexosaminidase